MKKIFMLALAAVTLLASCSKDDNGGSGVVEGGDANLRLSITLPDAVVGGTRADHDATTAESLLDDIHIYVFNTDGTAASQGAYTALDFSTDFTGSAGTYTMNPSSMIRTTAGTKKIYVIVNLTANGIPTTYTTEGQLLAAVADVHGALVLYNGPTNAGTEANVKSLVMLGSDTKQLDAIVSGSGNTVNTVEVEIERAVARVITTYDDTKFTLNGSDVILKQAWNADAEITFQLTKYTLVQDAHKSYLAPNFFPSNRVLTLISTLAANAPATWSSVINGPYNQTEYLGGSPARTLSYLPITKDEPAGAQQLENRAKFDRFYIGENASNYPNNSAQYGNTTMAWIQTYVSIDKTAKVDGAGTGIEYTGPALSGGLSGDDFYIIRVTSVADYIADATNYQPVMDLLKTIYPPSDVKGTIYPKGYVYYRVFLNKTETGNGGVDKYNVYRNQFIHIHITDLKANENDGFGGNNPGDGTDPEVPVTPVEPPIDPIDEQDADLIVNIKVLPWKYIVNGTVLQ